MSDNMEEGEVFLPKPRTTALRCGCVLVFGPMIKQSPVIWTKTSVKVAKIAKAETSEVIPADAPSTVTR